MSSDLRSRVIHAAKQSFSQFGYKGTTIEQIARQARVGKGTIYTFFESKETLLHHITDQLIQEMLAPLREAEQLETLLMAQLQHGLEGLLQLRQRQELFVKLSQELQLSGTIEVKQELQRIENEIVHYIASVIQRAVDREEIAPCHSELMAFLFYKMTVALIVEWEQTHSPLEHAEIEPLFLRMAESLLVLDAKEE